MQVTGDRTTPHGLSTVGYDDEGVAAQSFEIVRDGVLVGYQLDRRMAAENGLGRSNGCAFADSPLHAPIQRMANVSLAPAAGPGPSTEELISGVERGVYVVGDKSWSIDMQRHNFQFTGQRFYRIDHGRLAGQLRDVAYQATTTEFWGSLDAVGGRSTYVLGGAFNCGKGQPAQAAPVSHGCPSALFRKVNVLNARSETGRSSDGDRLPAAAEVIEQALSSSHSRDCIVIVSDGSEADVRFANNTTTTNGLRRDRRVTVISVVGARATAGATAGAAGAGATPGEAVAVGVASRGGAVDVAELVRLSEADAHGAPPADDAAPLVPAAGSTDMRAFGAPPALTDLSSLDGVVRSLAEAFGRARASRHVLAGFASHRVETTHLGSSTGLRLRHEQPTGTLELVARSHDGSRSSWAGAGTSWFDDVEVEVLHDRLVRRLDWAQRPVELPAGRYETLLPPDATADLMVVLSEAMSGRDAEDGRSPFSGPAGTTKLGESLASLPFTLRSDPAEDGLESSPFVVATASGSDVSVFDNGLAVAPTAWVRDGRLNALEYHRAAAARSGTVATPPGDNLMLELPGATASLDDMIGRTERGLLLTCLWYIRTVDPVTLLVTGLTRDGVYLVEGGEVVGAVNNFRFNESPIDVLARTIEAGRTERALSREWGEWQSRTAMPALRVADFNVSSVSPAT